MFEAEEWLPIPGYEGIYEVSDYGRVRSVDRYVPPGRGGTRWRFRRGQIRKPGHDRKGYLFVPLYAADPNAKNGKNGWVHRLVLLAFVGPPPEEGMYALHNNGDHSDNRLCNLRWGTPSENIWDSVAHGTHFNGSKTHCKRGHEFTPENTRRTTSGSRACRTCTQKQKREQYLARLASRAA
jgi:hypothetical protein